MACLAESELPHELSHPDHVIALLMRNIAVDDLDNSSGTMLEVLSMVDPLIAAFCRVAGVDHFEEAVEETLGNVLADEVWVDVAFKLECEAIHAAPVDKVVNVYNANDMLVDKFLRTVVVKTPVHGDDEWEASLCDGTNSVHDSLDSSRLELRYANRLLNVMVVKLLGSRSVSLHSRNALWSLGHHKTWITRQLT